MRTLSIITACLCTPLLLAGADRTFEKSFDVSPGGKLSMQTELGSVRVVGTDANRVQVTAELRGSSRDIEKFSIEAVQTSRGIEVTGKSDGRKWFWNFDDLDVEFTVKVPHEYSLLLTTSGGTLGVTGVKGKVEGSTSGGNIELREVEGAIAMETSGGNIEVRAVKGDLKMETSGGNITIVDVKGIVEVGTSGGGIAISGVEGRVTAETSGGDIRVSMREPNQGLIAETSGGDIDLSLPTGMAAAIDASTSGGEVTCDLPITMSGKLDESRIRGTVNGGGEMIRARTSGGDIRIKALK